MYLRRSSPTDFLRMGPPFGSWGCLASTRQDGERTTGRKIHTFPFDDESARCSASNRPAPRNAFFRFLPPCTTPFTSNAIFCTADSLNSFEPRRSLSGIKVGLRSDLDHDRILETVAVNVSMPARLLKTTVAIAMQGVFPLRARTRVRDQPQSFG